MKQEYKIKEVFDENAKTIQEQKQYKNSYNKHL